MEVMVLIGAANSRKSSTIRALTGVGKSVSRQGGNPNWLVIYNPGVIINTYVQSTALQEVGVLPADFVARVGKTENKKVVVALRLKARVDHGNPMPAYQAYLNAFANARWTIIACATLENNIAVVQANGTVIPTINIPNATAMASNEIAHQLRQPFGIL